MTDHRSTSIFLTVDEVLEIHQDQIEHYGGEAGLLNRVQLESAVAQPQVTFEGDFLYSDVYEMAAAYLFHLVQNHAFVDGNKRVGLASAVVFLSMNGHDIDVEDEVLFELVMAVARGELRHEDVSHFFRENCL